MSEFNYNLRGTSDSVFKVPTVPSRLRKTNCNNTQSTYNNDIVLQNTGSTDNTFKKVEERYEVLKKICPPEDVEKILMDTVDRLTEACYEKMAEQLVRPSHSQGFSVGSSSVYSLNTRPSAFTGANYDQPQETNRRKINSTTTSRNHYGLLNVPVSDHPPNFMSYDQPTRITDIVHEPESTLKSHVSKQVRSKKTVATSNDSVQNKDPISGLSIPLRTEKPNARIQPKRAPKKSPRIKELEILASEDESDSLSVFFGRGRKAASKPSITQAKQKYQNPGSSGINDISITLDRVSVDNFIESNAATSKKRKASQNDDVPPKKKSPASTEKEKRPSPDTTTTVSRKPQRNNSILTSRKSNESSAKKKENKENTEKRRPATMKSKSRKEIKKSKTNVTAMTAKDLEANTANGTEVFDDGSFFGDVSSIVGSDSMLLSNTVAKNNTKHSTDVRNEMPSHFFSPFANIRSTSGMSAISTPLSKTVSKNVLGKRLKKPSVVAELKSKQTRKARKPQLKVDIVQKTKNDSEDSESDPEGSVFSD